MGDVALLALNLLGLLYGAYFAGVIVLGMLHRRRPPIRPRPPSGASPL